MIEWLINNQIEFFFIVLVQYIVLATLQNKLGKRKILYPLFVVFIIQDWLMNMFMTLWFLDLPAELKEVVTKRMQRYKEDYSGIRLNFIETVRYKFAVNLCKILNIFDEDHC